MEKQNIPNRGDEEITLKEIILKLWSYIQEVWNKKWWIILLTIPFVLYFAYRAKTTIVLFPATLTYTLNDGSSGGGALSGILGSIGLGKGGKVNLEKIVELSKSRNIIHKVLFSKTSLDSLEGKEDYIANHLIVLHKFDEEWTNKDKDWIGFRFKSDSISHFNADEALALKMLYGKVIGGRKIEHPVFSNGFNDETGILAMTATTVNEELSIKFCNKAYQELKKFYEISSTKGGQNTFQFVEEKKDSILNMLESKKYQLAKFNDSHRNLTDPNLLVKKSMLETEIQKLTLMYGEATKNFEIADFSLESSTPDMTIIDEPLPPLDTIGYSFLIEIIKGGLFGMILSIGLIVGRKIFNDAMSDS